MVSPLALGVGDGVGDVVGLEAAETEEAGITLGACFVGGCGIVTGGRQAVIDAEFEAFGDDVGLGEIDEGSVNGEFLFSGDGGFCGEVGHGLVGADVLRTTIRIPAVIESIDADEDIPSIQHLGPSEGKRKKDRVSGRDVGDGDFVFIELGEGVVFGNGDIAVGERRISECSEIDGRYVMLDGPHGMGDTAGGFEFKAVALPIGKTQGVGCEALFFGDGETRRRVEATAEENDGFGSIGGRHNLRLSFLEVAHETFGTGGAVGHPFILLEQGFVNALGASSFPTPFDEFPNDCIPSRIGIPASLKEGEARVEFLV